LGRTFRVWVGHQIAVARWASNAAFGLAVFGTFANWIATLLAGLWGAGGMTPIAGGGAVGTPLQETLVAVLLLSLSFAMLASGAIVLWGLRRPRDFRASP
jgi:hydroxylaminobenzene mutase